MEVHLSLILLRLSLAISGRILLNLRFSSDARLASSKDSLGPLLFLSLLSPLSVICLFDSLESVPPFEFSALF